MSRSAKTAGFSLIEILIVVAIIGLLAAVAIPTYQRYAMRAKVSEGLTLAQPLKTAVGTYYAVNGGLPEMTGSWTGPLKSLGMPNSSQTGAASGHHVKRIWWWNDDQGRPSIKIRYGGGSALEDKLVFLSADFAGTSITWQCHAPSSDGVPEAYLPAECRD